MSYSNAVFFIDPENGSDTARTALTTVIASNPSGSITRMTKTAHGLTTGAVVTTSAFTTWLNGPWKITRVDADTFDLDDAVWQATADASGTVTPFGGSSFADAWKTMAAITSSVGFGSTIRVKESPAFTNPGNATWTNGSTTITWASVKNKVICNCDAAWTPSANVTSGAGGANVKTGTSSSYIAPAVAFTTGKLAYFTLPSTLDLSAFQQVSLWFYFAGVGTAGRFSLKLCSDSTGDASVNELVFPDISNSSIALVLDYGSALGSSINSIALYAIYDPSNYTIYMDNIVACKAPSSSDCVTHTHVISKNTVGGPEMYAILSIADDSIEVGGGYETTTISTSYQNRPYVGTTETVATYLMTGFICRSSWNTTTKRTYAGASGTASEHITISGGWNRTDMTTQTGATYLNGTHFSDVGLTITTKNYIDCEKFGFFYFRQVGVSWSGAGVNGKFEQLVGCYYISLYSISATANSPYYVEFTYVHGSNVSSTWGNNYYGDGPQGVIKGIRIHGLALNRASVSSLALGIRSQNTMFLERLDNVGGNGLTDEMLNQYGPAKLIGCTIENCYRDEVTQLGTSPYCNLLYGCTFTDVVVASADYGRCRVFSTRHGGVANDHRIYAHYFTARTDDYTRHAASGVAWKLSPTESTTYITPTHPAFFSLAKIAVGASALVTVKCWLRRDNTGISAGIRLLLSDIAGSLETNTQTLMTAAADTWEEVTLTFTPTAAGVVEIVGIAWGGTTYNAWFDDMTITQA